MQVVSWRLFNDTQQYKTLTGERSDDRKLETTRETSVLHRHFARGRDELGKLSISQTFRQKFVQEISSIHLPYKDEASDGMQVP